MPEGSVKVLKIALDDSSEAVEPSADTVEDGSYPIARGLFYYTDGDPSASDNEAVKAYIEYALSPAGQTIGVGLGFLAVAPTE